jgi:tetratricopeptide (TPR) repeat protein
MVLYGILLLNKGQGDGACEIYAKGLEYHPECSELLIYQEEAQFLAKKSFEERYAPLNAFYEKLILKDPVPSLKNAAILSKLAELKFELQNDPKSIDHLIEINCNRGIEAQEDFQERELGSVWRAIILRFKGKLHSAEAELEKILNSQPYDI